jgi:hypothetical protein
MYLCIYLCIYVFKEFIIYFVNIIIVKYVIFSFVITITIKNNNNNIITIYSFYYALIIINNNEYPYLPIGVLLMNADKNATGMINLI